MKTIANLLGLSAAVVSLHAAEPALPETDQRTATVLTLNTPRTFPDVKSKPLAFVLVDLAKANNTLPSLVEQLDLYAEKPRAYLASIMVKAYALRALGKTAEATKLIDEAIDAPKSVPEEIMVIYALTAPIPGGGESTAVPQEIVGPMLKKFLDRADKLIAKLQDKKNDN